MSPVVVMALRAVQALFALIILGLSAYVANWYNMDTLTASPTQINFMIAAPLFSLITIAYLELVPRFMPRMSHPYVSIFLEVFNVLNYFGGFIALAVFLSQLLFCRGSVCGAARADVVFASFSFALWSTSTVFLIRDVAKAGLRKQNNRIAMQEKAANLA